MKKIITFALFLLVMTMTMLTACNPPSHVQESPNFKDGRFVNAIPSGRKKSFWGFLTYRWKVEKGEWPEVIDNTATPQLQANPQEIVFTFINHATFLVEVDNTKILFDPMFSKTAGPASWLGVKRRRPPGIAINDLPPIDMIFITHNHYDHLDIPSLKFLAKKFQPQIFVPLGNKRMLEKKGIKNVTEMDWWQTAEAGDIKIDFVPAQHWSKRGLFDTNQTLWGGFVLRHPDITFYHAGDTGYAPHFKAIGDRFDIDIAMLPIGDYKPDWFMEYSHMNPRQAVQAHKDLRAKQSFGMHSETFQLTATDYREAEKDLQEALQNEPQVQFGKLKVGESFRYR